MAAAATWPIGARAERGHRHAQKHRWLDSDEDRWRCDYRACQWSRPAEPWEICGWFGEYDPLGGHIVVGSVVPAIAPEVCRRCGAPLCLLRPRRLSRALIAI